MGDVAFYQLRNTALEAALPKLLEKAVDGGMRVLVVAGSEDRADALSAALWTYDQNSFLPHGRPADGAPERQPVLIATSVENLNEASLLVTVDGVEIPDLDAFQRCVDMFDGRIESELSAARARWRRRADDRHTVTYYEQTPEGRWEKRA